MDRQPAAKLNFWISFFQIMVRVQPIQSFDRPELQPYRALRYQQQHRNQGIFVAESEKVVRRLVESDLEVVSVMLPDKWLPDYERLLSRRLGDIPVFVGPKELLETLTGFSMYQGVLAVGKVPPARPLETLLTNSSTPTLLVAADGMSNAQNMGALVRNCAAFGAQAVLVGETGCSPFIRRAVRASMGTIFHLPSLELENLAETLRGLRGQGVRVLAAHPRPHCRPPSQVDFTGRCCLVLGSEGEGIRESVLAQCDECVAIPMPPGVDSLNVASASAAFLYEAFRQRGGT
jgi:tRNA G18 (ribose-2'-O)-methylase SpoU